MRNKPQTFDRDSYRNFAKTTVGDFLRNNKHIIQYYRKPNGNPNGVIIFWRDEKGAINWGWSKVNVKAGDRWNKYIGLLKATDDKNSRPTWTGHEPNGEPTITPWHQYGLPKCMSRTFQHARERAERYFLKRDVAVGVSKEVEMAGG